MADKTEDKPKQTHLTRVQKVFSFIGTYGVGIVACLLVMLLMFVISMVLLRNGSVLKDLADPANARGIITFMISFAAIGLAFLMILHGLFGKSDQEQFRRAREIYAGLMGVLGTIVGFYFGSTDKPGQPLTLSDPKVMNRDFIAQASGGTAPYRYRITPDTLSGMVASEEKLSKDGWIQHELKSAPSEGRVTVEVWDSKNAFVSKDFLTVAVKLAPAAPAAAAAVSGAALSRSDKDGP
jgi:hypothetical protein